MTVGFGGGIGALLDRAVFGATAGGFAVFFDGAEVADLLASFVPAGLARATGAGVAAFVVVFLAIDSARLVVRRNAIISLGSAQGEKKSKLGRLRISLQLARSV